MRQILQDRRSGKIEIHDVPCPALREGFLLVRNGASLISSGTELAAIRLGRSSLLGKAMKRPDLVRKVIETARTRGIREAATAVASRLDEPLPMGYSSAGTVLEVAPDITGFAPGDRVACAGFGYASHAEIVTIPNNLAVRIPDGVTFEQACFVAMGAIALHGVRLSGAGIGDTAVVIGLGLLGLLSGQMLKAGGSQVIGVDPSAERCGLARELGIDHALQPDSQTPANVAEITGGRGADCVLITAATKSNAPVQLAGEVARDRARVCVVGDVGLQIPRNTYYLKELELCVARSYGPGRYDPLYEEGGIDYPIGYVPWPEGRNMDEFLRLLATGAVRAEPLTGRTFSIEEAPEAYSALESGDSRTIALVFTYPGTADTSRRIDVRAEARTPATADTVSFIGAGLFARSVLLPRFRRYGTTLRGVVTATGASASSSAQRFGFAFSATDEQAVLTDGDTSAIVIATRHDTHSRLAAAALRAGKHVYLEKPLALSRSELEEVLLAAQETERALVLGYNRRFAPLGIRLKEAFSSSESGLAIIYRVNAGPLPANHWTRDPVVGGGRIIGEACHFVDFMQYLTDADPVEVTAFAVPPPDGGSTDTVSFHVRFSDRSVGTVHYFATGDPGLPKERVEVFASRRTATLDDFRRLEVYSGGKRSVIRLRRQDKGHDNLVKSFLELCRAGGAVPIPYNSLRLTSLVTFAVEQALKEGNPKKIEL